MCLVYFLQRGSHVVKLFCVDAAFQRDIESELVVLSAMRTVDGENTEPRV